MPESMPKSMDHTDRQTQPSAWAFVLLLVGAAAIASAPIYVRLSEVGPVTTALWRAWLAVPMLGLALIASQGGAKGAVQALTLSWREYWRLGLAGAFFAGDLGVWHFSIHYTAVANATLLANLAPIFVTLFGFVLFKDRVTRLFLVGMIVAMAGSAILMGSSLSLSRQTFFGDLLGALTAVFYASYILAIGRLRARLGTLVVMFGSTLGTALTLVPLAWLSGEALLPETLRGWAVLAGLALTAHAFGQGLIAYALAHLPAAFSSVSLLFQPVVATFAAWVLFGEALGPLQGLGAVVVGIGVAVARQGSLSKGSLNKGSSKKVRS